jgi:hypothetical protein
VEHWAVSEGVDTFGCFLVVFGQAMTSIQFSSLRRTMEQGGEVGLGRCI